MSRIPIKELRSMGVSQEDIEIAKQTCCTTAQWLTCAVDWCHCWGRPTAHQT